MALFIIGGRKIQVTRAYNPNTKERIDNLFEGKLVVLCSLGCEGCPHHLEDCVCGNEKLIKQNKFD